MNAKRLLCAVLILWVIVLTLAFFRSSTRGDIRVVVLRGQPAPGFIGGRFAAFGGVSVNTLGDMAFPALVDVGRLQSGAIFAVLAGVLTPIALQGQPLPDGSGRTFLAAFSAPKINDNGTIVFSANFTPGTTNTRGIFEYSGGTLRNVIDESTLVPGGGNFSFEAGAPVLINNSGKIAFGAFFGSSMGIFTLSQGIVQTVFTARGFQPPFDLNNNGDIALGIPNDGISIYSGGTITQVVKVGQTVPNSNLVVPSGPVPAINDAKDIVFLTYGDGPCCSGRGFGPTVVPNGIVRWRAGALEKIVAAGDTVPGFSGAVFDATFGRPTVNVSGIVFTGSTAATSSQPATALVCEIRNGQLIVGAKQNDLIPGIGALGSVVPGTTSSDDQQGPIVTFQSETSFGFGQPGLFAATVASNDLQIPQIANGTATGGGWVTTILLANQSSSASSATVKFYDGNGAPMNVSVNGQQVTEVSLTVPALGVTQFQTDGTGPLVSGWGDVQSDQRLSGTALFGLLSSSGGLISQVGAPAGTALRAFAVFAQNAAGMSTGVALANPNPNAATVSLMLLDSNSNSVATASVSIPANGHLAKYIGEIFPSIAAGNFQGKLNIASTQPLIGLTLLQQGSLFTSLPIIP